MANLQGLKEYARVDDDESSLNVMLLSAKEYIADAGVPLEKQKGERYDLLVYMIALHWYEDRGTMVTGTIISEIPNSANSILIQLKGGCIL